MAADASRCHQLSIDRIENGFAVLVGTDGTSVEFPAALLPAGAIEGSVVKLELTLEEKAREALEIRIRKLQQELKKRGQ